MTETISTDPNSSELVSEIIDSSAITKYVSKEPDWMAVEGHLASADTIELAIKETTNALWKKIRRKEIELESAKKIVSNLSEALWLLDQRDYMERALEIATEHNITIYDALFLACAEVEKGKLVSCDLAQLEIAKKLGIQTVKV